MFTQSTRSQNMNTKASYSDMSPSFRIAMCVFAVIVAAMLASCTIVKVKTETAEVTIADLRVTGSAIDLEGVLNDVGSISVNREQGSALQDAAPIVEQLNPAPQFDITP
jgi:hypothetical protein